MRPFAAVTAKVRFADIRYFVISQVTTLARLSCFRKNVELFTSRRLHLSIPPEPLRSKQHGKSRQTLKATFSIWATSVVASDICSITAVISSNAYSLRTSCKYANVPVAGTIFSTANPSASAYGSPTGNCLVRANSGAIFCAQSRLIAKRRVPF